MFITVSLAHFGYGSILREMCYRNLLVYVPHPVHCLLKSRALT